MKSGAVDPHYICFMQIQEWDRAHLDQVHAFLILEVKNGSYAPRDDLPKLDLDLSVDLSACLRP